MGTLESGSPQSKTKGAPTAPEKHVGPAEVAGVDAIEGSEPIHIVIDPDHVDESITSISALLHDMRLERAEMGVDEIPHQEVAGARLVKLLTQYKEFGDAVGKKEKHQKKILLKQIEAAAEAFSTQGEIAGETEERFNTKEMPEPKGPGSGAPGKNGAPKKGLGDLADLKDTLENKKGEGDQDAAAAPATPAAPPPPPPLPQAPADKGRGTSNESKRRTREPITEIDVTNPEGLAHTIAQLEAEVRFRERWRIEKGKEKGEDIPRTGAERSAANLVDQLKRYQAGSVDDLAQMQSISRDFRRAVDAYEHFQTSSVQKKANEQRGTPLPHIKTKEDPRFITPLQEDRAKTDAPDADSTRTQTPVDKDAKKGAAQSTPIAGVPVADAVDPSTIGRSKKTGKPVTDVDAPAKTEKKKAPAKKSAVGGGVSKGRNKVGDENVINDIKGDRSKIKNKKTHKTITVSGERNAVVNAKGKARVNINNSVNFHGNPLTPQIDVPVNLMQGASFQTTAPLAPSSGSVRVAPTVPTGPSAPVAPAPTAPGAPGAPAARVATTPAAPAAGPTAPTPGAAPVAPATSAPAAPAAAPATPAATTGASPEDHIEAYKRWMAAGSPASGAPAVALTPAAAKKFEGILNNPADLTEIRALADTLAAAHVKEAAFNTPVQRMLGWVPFAFNKRKAEKKVAMQERAAAYDAWMARLQTHAQKVYAEAGVAAANKRGWKAEGAAKGRAGLSPDARKNAVLMRYRGLMARKLVQKQMMELEAKKVELMPPSEKGLLRKGLDVYRKLPTSVRVGGAALLVTGAVGLTGGFGGVAAGLIYGGSRFARGMVGVAVGTAVTKAVSRAAAHVLRSRAGLQKGEDHRANAYKRIGTEARKDASGGSVSDVRSLFQFYSDAVKKNDRDKLIALAGGAVAGMAAGAGTANLLQGIDSWLEPAKRGASAVVEPGLVNEDARAVGETPSIPSHVLTEEPGSLTPNDIPKVPSHVLTEESPALTQPPSSSSPGIRGPVDERDLENPAQRNGTSKGPVAPAEKSAPGKGAAPTPTPTPESKATPAPEGKGAPAATPTPEYKPPPFGPRVPENLGKPGVPPAEPSKPSVPDSLPRFFETPIQAQSGDTVWGITEKHLSKDPRFAALDRAQQDFVLDSHKNQLRSMGPEWLKKNGLSSGNIDKLRVGEAPNLSILDSADLRDSIFDKADVLTREERINILKYRGMNAADAAKLIDARVASAPQPPVPPAAPAPVPSAPAEARTTPLAPPQPAAPVQPPSPEPPATRSHTPMSTREEAVLADINQEPASIDADTDNELEVERERAGMELAEKIRTDERQTLIDQGTKLTEGEEAREEAARITREPIGLAEPSDQAFPNETLATEAEPIVVQKPIPPETFDPEHMAELSPRTRPGGAFNPDARHDSSIYTGPGYDPRMEGAGSLKTPEPIVVQGSAPQDYSAYTGEKPPFNTEAYGGVTEAQFNSLVRTHTMDTITEYFGTRGIFVQNSGFGRFDASIAWREARGFIEAVRSDPESMAESAGVNTKKLSAFVEYLERNAKNYNLSTKTSVSSLLEQITKRGIENSVSRTNLP